MATPKITSKVYAQVFMPNTIVGVASGTAFEPSSSSVAFRVPQTVGYFMGNSGAGSVTSGTATVVGGSITGIVGGQKYTFNDSFIIELM